MITYLANDCRGSNTGVLLLAEVALGKTNDLYNADYNAANLPPGTLSTKGIFFFHVITTLPWLAQL